MEVEVDMYIIASKGEGYPIILGRPWLIIMNAGQKWGIGILVLRPEGKSGTNSPFMAIVVGVNALMPSPATCSMVSLRSYVLLSFPIGLWLGSHGCGCNALTPSPATCSMVSL